VTFPEGPARLLRALQRVEAQIADQLQEVILVLSPDGAVVYEGAGERDAVAAPRDVLTGNIVVHNHPGGGSFSRRDVENLLENKIAQMRVITSDATYALDLPPDTEWDDVEDLVTILMDEVRERHADLVLAGGLTYEEAERRRWHEIWEGMAEIRGWSYRRSPRGTS
jgi:hypothetical protein